MKKTYVPLSISLQPLSAEPTNSSCAYFQSQAYGSCVITIEEFGEDETIFNSELGCMYDAKDICYHVPTQSSNVFGS